MNDRGWYIGYTSDLKQRVATHQAKHGGQTTSRKAGWKLMYCEGYLNKNDAEGRERFLKSGAGRRFIKKQLSHYLGGNGV